MKATLSKIKDWAQYRRALLWQRLYRATSRVKVWRSKYTGILVVAPMIFFMAISFYFTPTLQNALEAYFAVGDRFDVFKTVLMTIGGALIGGTAVVFSFVLFAMQVNVERMPHRLFHKFSTDARLLGTFALIFFIALAITVSPAILNMAWLAVTVLLATFGVLAMFMLFLYAYKRALQLINPIVQLGFVVEDACNDLQAWAQRAQRATPPFREVVENASKLDAGPGVDQARFQYFRSAGPLWTNKAKNAIETAVIYVRRYAEQGDYAISRVALHVIVRINAAYVKAKGRTFFANYLFFENIYANDDFINNTLEHLRQNARLGISRDDEQQIEHTFQAMRDLCWVYLGIDYGLKDSPKEHANLAAGYLSAAVQSAVPHNMTDVLMEGLRCIGQVGQAMAEKGQAIDLVPLSDSIEKVALAGVAKNDLLPATKTGMEQFAKMTVALIVSKSPDIRSATDQISSSATRVTKLFFSTPTATSLIGGVDFLSSYYSTTDRQSLLYMLTALANELSKIKEENALARDVAVHIKRWADSVHSHAQEVFLLAIEKRLVFVPTIIDWVFRIAEILMMVACGTACPARIRGDLVQIACSFVQIFSSVPDKEDAIRLVGAIHQADNKLFGVAMNACEQKCEEVADAACELLLEWGFKAGKHGYRSNFAQSCYALAMLDLKREKNEDIVAVLSKRIEERNEINQSIRDEVARTIRKKAHTLRHDRSPLSRLDAEMIVADARKLCPLLEKIADTISPDTKGQISSY